jgi:hypothetical protein
MKGCSSTFKSFKQFMESINKYVKRAVIDIQYYLNSAMVDAIGTEGQDYLDNNNNNNNNRKKAPINVEGEKASLELKSSLSTFLNESEEYLSFYEEKLKWVFENLEREANCRDLDNFEIHSDRGNCD